MAIPELSNLKPDQKEVCCVPLANASIPDTRSNQHQIVTTSDQLWTVCGGQT